MAVAAREIVRPSDVGDVVPFPSAAEAIRLPVDQVDPNANHPRVDLREIDELASSISEFGLLQPLAVRRTGGRFELLAGHRRLAAVKLLGERDPDSEDWRTIVAVVRSLDDDNAFLAMLAAQLHSRAWSAREEATALERLLLTGMTVEQIGAALHRSQAWASKRLAIYADSILSGAVQAGRLSAGVAEELLPERDAAKRRAMAERAIAEGWSQDRARSEFRRSRADGLAREVSGKARALSDILRSVDVAKLGLDARRDLLRLDALIVERIRPASFPSVSREGESAA